MLEYAVCAVQGGSYPIGDDHLEASRPQHTVPLEPFGIGLTTVTCLHYVVFIVAGGYDDASLWSEAGWRWRQSRLGENARPAFWDDARFNQPDLPVVGVSWYEARAFASWMQRESEQDWGLPSEVQWEAAARGLNGERWPQGEINSAENGRGITAADVVANRSWCGALNLCGNVWEWTSSRWGRSWQTLDYRYPYNPSDGRENVEGTQARIMRGGSWFDMRQTALPAHRGRYLPGSRGSNIGFRLILKLG